jgi:hypothetical protein
MWNGQCHLQQHLHLQVLGGAAGTLAQSKQDAVVGWERMRARENTGGWKLSRRLCILQEGSKQCCRQPKPRKTHCAADLPKCGACVVFPENHATLLHAATPGPRRARVPGAPSRPRLHRAPA